MTLYHICVRHLLCTPLSTAPPKLDHNTIHITRQTEQLKLNTASERGTEIRPVFGGDESTSLLRKNPSGKPSIRGNHVWLWKHYKLSPRANCDKWALCALCQKGGETVWIPRSDGSTTRMKKHLIDVHNMYAGWRLHACIHGSSMHA